MGAPQSRRTVRVQIRHPLDPGRARAAPSLRPTDLVGRQVNLAGIRPVVTTIPPEFSPQAG